MYGVVSGDWSAHLNVKREHTHMHTDTHKNTPLLSILTRDTSLYPLHVRSSFPSSLVLRSPHCTSYITYDPIHFQSYIHHLPSFLLHVLFSSPRLPSIPPSLHVLLSIHPYPLLQLIFQSHSPYTLSSTSNVSFHPSLLCTQSCFIYMLPLGFIFLNMSFIFMFDTDTANVAQEMNSNFLQQNKVLSIWQFLWNHNIKGSAHISGGFMYFTPTYCLNTIQASTILFSSAEDSS